MSVAENSKKRVLATSVAQVDPGEAQGCYLELKDPAKAARLLDLIAEGVPFSKIRKMEGCSFYTLVRLQNGHKVALEKRREELALDALNLAEGAKQLQYERFQQLMDDPEALAKINPRDLAMTYGIYMDKYQMATEGNRVVIEHKGSEPSLADAVKAIEEARAKLRGLSVEVKVEEIKEEAKP